MNSLIDRVVSTTSNVSDHRREALVGALIGTAVGDALGLPMEGLSARRQEKLFPKPLRHQFMGRYGMVSDDTEHTFMVAQSLLEFPADRRMFQRRLAHRLKWWLAALPAAVGWATLRAILKLWVGIPAHRSGVFSAGNGPAMRSALLGVYFANDPKRRREFVTASSEVTHRDPRAITGALAVAETATWMMLASEDTNLLLTTLAEIGGDAEWSALVTAMREALHDAEPVRLFARRIGCVDRVTGYAYQSVPVAIYTALRHRADFSAALSEAIGCGGDTDSMGAIAGALVGTRVGLAGIPRDWREGIVDFPLNPALLCHVAEEMDCQITGLRVPGPVRFFWPAVPLRNLVFLAVVLAHGFRRLLPPY